MSSSHDPSSHRDASWLAPLLGTIACGWSLSRGETLLVLLLLIAIWMVVPLGARIALPGRETSTHMLGRLRRWLLELHPAAAGMATAALWTDGIVGAVTAGIWVLWTSGAALAGGVDLWQGGFRSVERVSADVGLLFLGVGGGWFLMGALPVNPTPFAKIIVWLTAAHFHVGGLAIGAGFAGTERTFPEALSRLNAFGTGAYALGFVLVATGISGVSPLQLIGTLVLTVALVAWVISVGTQLPVAWSRSAPAATLLGLASATVLSGMGFAAWYAWGQWPADPTLSIPTMLRYHGGPNTVGFALPMLLALHWLESDRAPDR